MSQYFKDYLKKNNFNKHLKKLKKLVKNKTVIVYGTGMLFQFINDNYDLSELNIIGISDMKFSKESEGQESLGYKIIPKSEILKYNPDYVIVASENYIDLIENLELKLFKDTKVKVLPLVKKNIWNIIKIIWESV